MTTSKKTIVAVTAGVMALPTRTPVLTGAVTTAVETGGVNVGPR